MKLLDGDQIVTAWAENCSGPGWSNQLVWVLVRERGGKLREEAVQPSERTAEMATLHNVSAAVTRDLTAIVSVWAERGGR